MRNSLAVAALLLAACSAQPVYNNASAPPPAPAASSNAAAAMNVSSSVPGAVRPPLTPDQIRAMMQRDGVTQTVTAFQDPSFFETNRRMTDGIAAGDAQWLALVPLLSTSGSAEMSEGLIYGLADALPRNPAGVLQILSDRQTNDFLKDGSCRHPEELSGQQARAYIATTTRAVEAVSDPALQAARTRCLANLRQALSEVSG